MEVFQEWTQKHPKAPVPHTSLFSFCEVQVPLLKCLCREKPGFKDLQSRDLQISLRNQALHSSRHLIGDNSSAASHSPKATTSTTCYDVSPLCGRPRLQNLSCTKGHFSWGPSHSRPPKNRKIPHIFGTTQGSKRFHIKSFKFKLRNMHLKDSFDESVLCFTCFCWWGFGGKMLKCFKVFLERKRGPTTNGCYKNPLLGPLHLGHPQTANCQFRKLDIRQFLVCPQMGHVVFFCQDQ